jgi:hypothetical protein
VVIVDAGGGTVDISSYNRNKKEGFEEIAAPQCSFVFIILKLLNSAHYIPGHFYGSVFFFFFFCDHACKTVFREYVVVKPGPLYHYSTSLPRLLD